MPGEPGRAPPPAAAEVWPSVAPFGEADRISVSIIVLAFLCSSAGSTFASPGGNNHTWPPTAQTTGLDQVSGPRDRRPFVGARHPLRPHFAVEQCRPSMARSPGHQLADPDHQQWPPHNAQICGAASERGTDAATPPNGGYLKSPAGNSW